MEEGVKKSQPVIVLQATLLKASNFYSKLNDFLKRPQEAETVEWKAF